MINRISSRKVIALTRKNNQKVIQQFIRSQDYIYIFTNPKIALFKNFKANILNNPQFARWLCLLAINKIYFVEKQKKNFQPLYTKIEKV